MFLNTFNCGPLGSGVTTTVTAEIADILLQDSDSLSISLVTEEAQITMAVIENIAEEVTVTLDDLSEAKITLTESDTMTADTL